MRTLPTHPRHAHLSLALSQSTSSPSYLARRERHKPGLVRSSLDASFSRQGSTSVNQAPLHMKLLHEFAANMLSPPRSDIQALLISHINKDKESSHKSLVLWLAQARRDASSSLPTFSSVSASPIVRAEVAECAAPPPAASISMSSRLCMTNSSVDRRRDGCSMSDFNGSESDVDDEQGSVM